MSIREDKLELEKLSTKIMEFVERRNYGNHTYRPEIEDISENIILWRLCDCRDYDNYVYSNLEGNILFDQLFLYATSFSNSLALVEVYKGKFVIINLEKRELIDLPDGMMWKNTKGIEQNNLVVFDKNFYKWGSYKLNLDDYTFDQGIPFIWDQLEFSRKDGLVYVGNHELTREHNYNPYFGFSEDANYIVKVPLILLPTEWVQDFSHYDLRLKYNRSYNDYSQMRILEEKISYLSTKEEREEVIKKLIRSNYNIRDYYFNEYYKDELNNNDGTIRDCGDMKEYKKVLSTFKGKQ